MKKFLGVTVVSLAIIGIASYFLLFGKELDDDPANGPIQAEVILSVDQVPLFEGILAAGISWDFDQDRFYLSTDQPHGLFTDPIAKFYVVDNSLSQVLFELELETDGDLEGIAYIGSGEVAVISEPGSLYFLSESDDGWANSRTVSVFEAGEAHKLGSLAYDPVTEMLFSAEKEGIKRIYVISRNGELLDSFQLDGLGMENISKEMIDTSYTISGMTFDDEHLLIFSEAYSTLFRFDLETRQITNVYGVSNIHESAGITSRQGYAYLVGDDESYLPPPSIYKVKIPD